MNKSSYWSLYKKTDRIRNRMIYNKWRNLKVFSNLYRLITSILSDIGECCTHISLFKLDKLICHRSSIEWRTSTKLFHKVVDSSDMIDMTMSDTCSYDFFPTTVGKIRYGRVDTILILIWELYPHIDDDHLILILESHTVKSYLFHTTEWDNPKGSFCERFYALLFLSEKFLECLSGSEKRIGSLWSEWVLKEKWISRTKIGLEFFSRIEKVSRSSFWALACASIALKAFITHDIYDY